MAAISMLLVVILACSGNAQIQSATGGEAKAKGGITFLNQPRARLAQVTDCARFLSFSSCLLAAPAAFTEVSFPLQHSLGKDAPFTLAGTFTARAYFDKSGTVRPRWLCTPVASFPDLRPPRVPRALSS